jgi:hypothetical protein
MEKCKKAEEYYMQFPDIYLQNNFYKYNLTKLNKKLKQLEKQLSKKIFIL